MGEDMAGEGRRARPAQARSQATLERILEAARRVLVERGVQGFNTNVVAEQAGVNVGTLYHYFADKNAVLRELFECNEEIRRVNVQMLAGALATTDDPGAWARLVVKSVSGIRASAPADLAVRRACRAIPELASADEAASAAAVAVFVPAVRTRYPFLSERRARSVSRTLVDVTRSMLDHAGDHPNEAAAIRKELEVVLSGYLGAYEQQR